MKEVLKTFAENINGLFLTKKQRRHKLVGPPQLWKAKRDFQINFLKAVGLQKYHSFLDIGCGTLRGGIPLINYLNQDNYYGIESRDFVMEEGKKELRENKLEHKNAHLIVSNALNTLNLNREFDFVWAFAVLIHMDDKIVEKCFSMVSRHLKSTGKFYASVNFSDKPEGSWQGFPVVMRSMEFYESLAKRYNLMVKDFGPLENLGHVGDQLEHGEQRMLLFTRKWS